MVEKEVELEVRVLTKGPDRMLVLLSVAAVNCRVRARLWGWVVWYAYPSMKRTKCSEDHKRDSAVSEPLVCHTHLFQLFVLTTAAIAGNRDEVYDGAIKLAR